MHDPTDPVGRLLFNVLAMVAEFEADLIRLRTREGMKVAKAKGRLRGKQPKLNPRQEAHLVALHHAGEHSTAELGDLFGVARSPSTGPSSAKRHERKPPTAQRRSVADRGSALGRLDRTHWPARDRALATWLHGRRRHERQVDYRRWL